MDPLHTHRDTWEGAAAGLGGGSEKQHRQKGSPKLQQDRGPGCRGISAATRCGFEESYLQHFLPVLEALDRQILKMRILELPQQEIEWLQRNSGLDRWSPPTDSVFWALYSVDILRCVLCS